MSRFEMNEMDVSVVLHLVDHCIETEARRALKARQARLLEDAMPEDEDMLAGEMEMLQDFLTSWDFRALRAADPDLAGGRDLRVRVFRRKEGLVDFEKLAP